MRALGALLAFYEHRTYCFGQLVNINSFDQMGVELGKRLATDVSERLTSGLERRKVSKFDPSTEAMLRNVKNLIEN